MQTIFDWFINAFGRIFGFFLNSYNYIRNSFNISRSIHFGLRNLESLTASCNTRPLIYLSSKDNGWSPWPYFNTLSLQYFNFIICINMKEPENAAMGRFKFRVVKI